MADICRVWATNGLLTSRGIIVTIHLGTYLPVIPALAGTDARAGQCTGEPVLRRAGEPESAKGQWSLLEPQTNFEYGESWMKRCARCGEDKDRSCFSRMSRAKDGLQAHCRDCSNAVNRGERTQTYASLRPSPRVR